MTTNEAIKVLMTLRITNEQSMRCYKDGDKTYFEENILALNQGIGCLEKEISKSVIETRVNEEYPNCKCEMRTRHGARCCEQWGPKLTRGG